MSEAETFKAGDTVRLDASHKDRGTTRIKAVHESGTAVILIDPLGGYFHWNVGDIERADILKGGK